MTLFLGIDLGTSYLKVGLFDTAGVLQGLGRVAAPLQTPAPGRCEMPVELFWDALRRGLEEALTQADTSVVDIGGISYSSQANTFVLMDRQDRPLTPLVVWLDERGEPVEERLKRFSETGEFARRTGFRGINGSWAVAKWRWWQKNHPRQWSKARRVMTLSDYLSFSLTGERVGDASTAAFLGLYDLAGREWWADALQAFQIDPEQLSDPLIPGTRCGRTSGGAAARLGLPSGIPFTVGGLDHHVAGVGSGLGRLGEVSISTGTVLAAMTRVEEVTPKKDCFHGPDFDAVRFYRLAFDSRGAGQLEGYQQTFAPDRSIEQLLALAALAPPGCIPDHEPGAGVSDQEHGQSVRHLLEHIALGHRTLLGQVMGDRSPPKAIVATGGGARSPLWLQIKAAMLQTTIVKPRGREPACLGASLLAAVGAGIFEGLDEASDAAVCEEARYVPDTQLVEVYREWKPDERGM